ncbi:hypothetical protein VR010_15030 [Actinomycetaceae bacterium L2_0104]
MDTSQQLAEITERARLIPDVLSTIMGISGITYDPVSASASLSLDGPSERAVTRAEGVNGVLEPLVDLVHEWAGVRGETVTRSMTGQPATWLRGRAAWAEKNYPGWRDAQQIISTVHHKIACMTGYGPDRSDRKCPHCNTHIERHPTNSGLPDLWTCPTCHRAWIITPTHDGLADTQREILSQQHILVTQAQAAHITGCSRQAIHNWITRGHLTTHNGHVYLDHVTQLAIPLRV